MNHKVEDFRARRLKNFEENVMPNCRMVGADREQFIKNYHDTTEDLISIQFGSDEIYETEQQEDIVAIDEVKEASEDPMDYVFDTIGDSFVIFSKEYWYSMEEIDRTCLKPKFLEDAGFAYRSPADWTCSLDKEVATKKLMDIGVGKITII
jgi:hypothetical protein